MTYDVKLIWIKPSIPFYRVLVLLLLKILVLCPAKMQAQDYTSLSNYFHSKKETYQSWLQEVELQQYLKVVRLHVYEDALILELNINTLAQDSSVAIWNRLKLDFMENNPISLEKRLFLKMAHTFDVAYEDISIRVRSETTGGEIPAVDGRIKYNEETGAIETKNFLFRSEVTDTLTLEKFRVNQQFVILDSIALDKTTAKKNKYEIYGRIRDRAREYFESKPGAEHKFRAGIEDPLTFEVKNIKEEVISAKWVNPHELLYFTITVSQDEENLLFDCIIDGKYGSGLFFLTPTDAANYAEMFPKYQKELKNYLQLTFKPLLFEWLSE